MQGTRDDPESFCTAASRRSRDTLYLRQTESYSRIVVSLYYILLLLLYSYYIVCGGLQESGGEEGSLSDGWGDGREASEEVTAETSARPTKENRILYTTRIHLANALPPAAASPAHHPATHRRLRITPLPLLPTPGMDATRGGGEVSGPGAVFIIILSKKIIRAHCWPVMSGALAHLCIRSTKASHISL